MCNVSIPCDVTLSRNTENLGHISQISTAITESKSGKTDVGGNKPIRGRIFIITPSLLDFFRNSQYPEK